MSSTRMFLAGLLSIVAAAPAFGNGWQALVNQPSFDASTMFLLTDGRILVHQDFSKTWWTLKPDANGSYLNGSWIKVASSKYDRLYYAGAVFADGRVIVAGGEYSQSGGSETNKTEIYDPVLNTWTEISPPSGWSNIGDAPCTILADGRLLLGSIFDQRTAFYDPVAGTWTAGPNKRNASSTEESWVLLPDGTVESVDCYGHPGSEKYVPSQNAWVNTGSTPVDLVEAASLEVGPGILMNDGRTFFMGATPHCCLYTMPANPPDPGTWTQGGDPPLIGGKTIGAKDAPASILPSGNVLCALGPVTGVFGDFLPPTYFFEFNGASLVRVPDPPNNGGPPYVGRMMLLPTGQVLFVAGTTEAYAYTCDGGPSASWKPAIASVATTLERGQTYPLSGTQLNGLTQAVGYGDDADVATNYPLVRVKNAASGHVFYCRTSGHSTMAVATGSAIVSTNFLIASNVETGAATLEVVANAIPSDPVSVVIVDITDVAPASLDVLAGRLLAGSAAQLAASDDQDVVVERELALHAMHLAAPPVQVELHATSPATQPASLAFTLEAGVSAAGLVQTIELYDFAAQSYEVEDVRAATLSESTVHFEVTNPARFVASGTKEMRARISFTTGSPLQVSAWQARLDFAQWAVGR